VSLANRDNREVVLQKGQMSRVEINEPPTKPESVNLDHFLAWRSGRIEFQRTPLRAVVDELQRQFDLSIQLANPDSAELTLTASFQISQPLPEVLSAIGLTFGWDFHKSNGVFIIENK
jgi:ferric-dicitrate binding protein FerR (iron transport regulator)